MYGANDRHLLATIFYKQDQTLAMLRLLFKSTQQLTAQLEEMQMATEKEVQDLLANLSANTNATQAAHDALLHYATSTQELTTQLQAALAAANVSDPRIDAAIGQLATNTQDLVAATPQVAVAVTTNTKEQQAPDAPPPAAAAAA